MKIVLLTSHRFGLYGYWSLLKHNIKPAAIFTSGNLIKQKSKTLQNVNYFDWYEFGNAFEVDVFNVEDKYKFQHYLDIINPDLMIVLGWFKILPKEIFSLPKNGTVLLHSSLLPKYRGGAPITWQLINDEPVTGITLFYLSEGIDDGDIIAQASVNITIEDDIKTLSEKLYRLGGQLINDNIEAILNNTAPRIKQNEAEASIFRMRSPSDGMLTHNMTVYEAYNHIRAQTRPYPGAYIDNKRIWKADYRIYDYSEDRIKFSDGYMKILEWEEFNGNS